MHNDSNHDKLSIGTWNSNALAPHVHEIIALEADIIALQEVRIGADSVPGMRSIFKQYGYNLHFSGLPNYKKQGHNKKSIHLEQTVPGVAFAIRSHIPVQEISVESMGNWFQKGRFLAVKTFLFNRDGSLVLTSMRLRKTARRFLTKCCRCWKLTIMTVAFCLVTLMPIHAMDTSFRTALPMDGFRSPTALTLTSTHTSIAMATPVVSTFLL